VQLLEAAPSFRVAVAAGAVKKFSIRFAEADLLSACGRKRGGVGMGTGSGSASLTEGLREIDWEPIEAGSSWYLHAIKDM
jgi:hypothetical protein